MRLLGDLAVGSGGWWSSTTPRTPARRSALAARPGRVLNTSRNPSWRGVASAVGVREFARAQSITLLRAVTPELSEADADRAAEAVGDLPLAVDQAGSLLHDAGLDVEVYLRLLRERAADLLAHGSSCCRTCWLPSTRHLDDVPDEVPWLLNQAASCRHTRGDVRAALPLGFEGVPTPPTAHGSVTTILHSRRRQQPRRNLRALGRYQRARDLNEGTLLPSSLGSRRRPPGQAAICRQPRRRAARAGPNALGRNRRPAPGGADRVVAGGLDGGSRAVTHESKAHHRCFAA